MEDQVKRTNLYLISLFIFLILFNVSSFAYSQNTTNTRMDQIQNATEKQKDLLSYLFDNSITSMLLSTFVIAIVGVLITKLRSFKKKLDMIEILTRAQVKMKKLAEDRETRIELKFKELDGKIERNWNEMDKKIDLVDKHATDALIKYLSESSFDRKR